MFTLANKISLNLDKICFSVFGVHDDNDRCKVQLRFGHVTLKHVNCCKYLGIIIDNNLIWLEHNLLITSTTKYSQIY